MVVAPDLSQKEKPDRSRPEGQEIAGRKPEGAKVEKRPEGKEKAPDSTKTKLEDLKPEFKDFTLYGVKILRERDQEKNTVKFYEGSKDKPIPILQEWIKNKLKETEKKKIEEGLKPYENLFKELNIPESEKQKRLKDLKDRCFKMHEEGKTPQKLEEIPSNISLILKRISAAQFSVDTSAEKITIPYALVLPPNVSTIVVTREDPKTKQKIQIVCIKYGPKGNEHFLDADTGMAIFLKPNDVVDIAALTEPEKAATKAEGVSSDVKSTLPTGGGSYGGGGFGGGGGGLSSSETGDKKSDKKEDEKPKMTNQDIETARKDTKETKENYGTGDFNVRKIENREFNGGRPVYIATFPKNLDPTKKTRYVLYIHGFGVSREKAGDIFKNNQATGGMEKYTKDKNENIVFVMPEGEKNEPAAGNYFGETFSSQSRIENLVNYTISYAFEGKNPPESNVERYIMGHSGANYAMEKALKNAPPNYFKGIGLFDSLYSEGTGKKYADLLKNKHAETNVFSIFRNSGKPGRNNPVLKDELASRKSGPNGHFETRSADSDHGAMKYAGISGALVYFAQEEANTEQKKV